MFFNKLDSYSYSRPVSYRSYYPKLTKNEILPLNDPESQEVLAYLRQQNIEANDLGGLARGIRFLDFEIGRRIYNHNSYNVSDEYYIHQQKDTNDLSSYHPTGTHLVFKNYAQFLTKLRQVIDGRTKKY